uniref:Protein kinase domain-containing protein n=1 Tax=Salix viminalis TaxID=40686 RepID=A0A6N2KX10_SALVM
MGICTSKPSPNSTLSSPIAIQAKDNTIPTKDTPRPDPSTPNVNDQNKNTDLESVKRSPFPFYSPSPARYFFSKKSSPARSPARNAASANSTPNRFFKRPFPPPSPAKHIRAVLARRHGSVKPNEATIPEGSEAEAARLVKSFGFSKHFGNKYELGDEVGEDILMTTAIAIEDVRREVNILRALTGHNNLVRFYDAYEDHDNVYIVMELCEGGELLDRILARGGKYTEDDAKAVMIQILNVVAFCHLQGVVHRDLKPENFLFTSKDEDSQLKAIDFGLSDFVKPGLHLLFILRCSWLLHFQ